MASVLVLLCANTDKILLAIDVRLRANSYARTACPVSKLVDSMYTGTRRRPLALTIKRNTLFAM
jgi:hypothetical protein